MCKLFADAVVLMGILYLLLRHEAPDFYHVIFVALGMSVANLVCALALVAVLGVFVIIPIVVIDGLILMIYCHLNLKYAVIALALLVAYNALFYGVMLSR